MEGRSLFYVSIQSLLKSWTGLQLAVSNGFGGPQSQEKAQWLVAVIETFFEENKNIDPGELEDFIEEIFYNEFDSIAKDDSIKLLTNEICSVFKLYKEGKHKEIKDRLNLLPCVNVAESVNTNPKTISTPPNVENLVDKLTISTENLPASQNDKNVETIDDGWTVVKSKKR